MIRRNFFIAPLAFLMLASCGGSFQGGGLTRSPVDVTQLPAMRVAAFQVTVPETLTVSEDNSLDPPEKIVWRGDPYGPRHAQVKAVMETGIRKGTKDLSGDLPVRLDIVVQRFHSQTQKVRYSYGGKYEIEYDLTVLNANTGEVIVPPYRVYAEINAPGGVAALAADQAGRTEKMDNINLIARSIHRQLTGRELATVPVTPG